MNTPQTFGYKMVFLSLSLEIFLKKIMLFLATGKEDDPHLFNSSGAPKLLTSSDTPKLFTSSDTSVKLNGTKYRMKPHRG